MEFPMKRLVVSAFSAFVFLAAAAIMQWSQSPSIARPVGPEGLMSLQKLQAAARVNKLPIEEYEDLSLVYSTVTKR
jgi:hypothetical protein